MPDVKIDGSLIVLGQQEYILPPLPLVKMAKVSRLMSGGNVLQEEYVDSLVDALWWSLKRNYKDLDRQAVEDNLDSLNFKQVLEAFMQVNGFENGKEPGEAAASN